MALRNFKVLTFDVVGTLIDFERGMLNYLRKVGRSRRRGAQRRRHPRLLPPASRQHTDPMVSRRSGACLRSNDPDLGLPTGKELAEGFRNSIKDWPPSPNSIEALRRLRARYELVAMTNAQRWALNSMQKTLLSPFQDTVTVDEARCEKPDPVFFGFTRGRLSKEGHVLEDILHVAQSQYHDIGVARTLVRTETACWIERRKGLKGSGGTLEAAHTTPDYHFATLAELADAIDKESTEA